MTKGFKDPCATVTPRGKWPRATPRQKDAQSEGFRQLGYGLYSGKFSVSYSRRMLEKETEGGTRGRVMKERETSKGGGGIRVGREGGGRGGGTVRNGG